MAAIAGAYHFDCRAVRARMIEEIAMLKHFAPALMITALLVASSAVFATDAATTPAHAAQAAASDTAKTMPAPKPKKMKLHHHVKKTAKPAAKAGSTASGKTD
jgi:hypothetical protein